MRHLTCALLLALLAACGGGDPEDDDCTRNAAGVSEREQAQWRQRCVPS